MSIKKEEYYIFINDNLQLVSGITYENKSGIKLGLNSNISMHIDAIKGEAVMVAESDGVALYDLNTGTLVSKYDDIDNEDIDTIMEENAIFLWDSIENDIETYVSYLDSIQEYEDAIKCIEKHMEKQRWMVLPLPMNFEI